MQLNFRAYSKTYGMRGVMGWLGTTLYVENGGVGCDAMDMENWEIMSSTGLKDKNGKEIYEGDVIRSYHEKSEVISHLGSFGSFFNPQDFTSLADIWERGDGHKVEVIGNIYENPELI